MCVAVQLCQKTVTLSKKTVEPMLDLAQVADASQKLTSLLDSVLAYVEDVLAGRVQPDNAVGRALLDMVNSVPKMTPDEFENMFNSNIKVGQKAAYYTEIDSYVLTAAMTPT
jgi:translation initiation factor 3 subunit F